MSKLPQLKPCPFCGGKAQLKPMGGKGSTHAWIECSKCEAEINWYTTLEAAIEAWNQRTNP